jgi:hypothetical protein
MPAIPAREDPMEEAPIEIRLTKAGLVRGFLAVTAAGLLMGWTAGVVVRRLAAPPLEVLLAQVPAEGVLR